MNHCIDRQCDLLQITGILEDAKFSTNFLKEFTSVIYLTEGLKHDKTLYKGFSLGMLNSPDVDFDVIYCIAEETSVIFKIEIQVNPRIYSTFDSVNFMYKGDVRAIDISGEVIDHANFDLSQEFFHKKSLGIVKGFCSSGYYNYLRKASEYLKDFINQFIPEKEVT